MEYALFFLKVFVIPGLAYLLGRALIRHFIKSEKGGLRGLLDLTLIFGILRLAFFLGDLDQKHLGIQICQGLFLFFLAYSLIRILENIFFEKNGLVRHRVPMLFRDIMRFLLLIMVVMVLLKVVLEVDLSALVVTSTVMSAIIGLALQDMLSNLVAGVALQIEAPFKVGHWVRVGDREGIVVGMSWRSTSLRTRDSDVVMIPNSSLAQSEILNFNVPESLHLARQRIGTSYSDSPGKVKAVLIEMLMGIDGVLNDPQPEVFLVNYLDFAIEFEIRFWINDYQHEPRIRDRIMERLWYVFKRENISIPFPIRNIVIEEQTQVLQQKAEENILWQEKVVELMGQSELMRHFNKETLTILVSEGETRVYANGEYLVRQDDSDSSFFTITSGKVTVSVQNPDGETTVLGTFEQGYFFGEGALLTGSPRAASVRALTHVEALVIGKEAVTKALKQNPEMVEALTQVIKNRAAELAAHVGNSTTAAEKEKGEQELGKLHWVQRFFNI